MKWPLIKIHNYFALTKDTFFIYCFIFISFFILFHLLFQITITLQLQLHYYYHKPDMHKQTTHLSTHAIPQSHTRYAYCYITSAIQERRN